MGSFSSILKKNRINNNLLEVTFTEEEIQIIQKLWSNLMLNVDKSGVGLFKRLFTLNRHLMGNFDFAVAYELDLERMIDDARVVFHVRRVIYAIDSVISSLHYGLADALLHIFQIGSNHARFGLKRIHFEDMQEALFVLLTDEFGDAFDTSAKLAYAKLFKTIVDHMLAGVESRYEKSIT